jgi:hypothetical protein
MDSTPVATSARAKETRVSASAPRHAKKGRDVASLDRAAMLAGIQAVEPRVKRCYQQHRQKGVAPVRIDVGPDGKVKKVTVSGPLARTRTGACVKAAVKTARFRGGGTDVQYPFVLP